MIQISIRATEQMTTINKILHKFFLYLAEWFQQQTLSNISKTIIRFKLF